MNGAYWLVETVLKEQDELGPSDGFTKKENEKVLFQMDNIVWVQDKRHRITSSDINSKGRLVITNQRLFFKPKYFSSGSSEILDIPLEKIITAYYGLSLFHGGFNRKLVVDVDDFQTLLFTSPDKKLKRAFEVLENIK